MTDMKMTDRKICRGIKLHDVELAQKQQTFKAVKYIEQIY